MEAQDKFLEYVARLLDKNQEGVLATIDKLRYLVGIQIGIPPEVGPLVVWAGISDVKSDCELLRVELVAKAEKSAEPKNREAHARIGRLDQTIVGLETGWL